MVVQVSGRQNHNFSFWQISTPLHLAVASGHHAKPRNLLIIFTFSCIRIDSLFVTIPPKIFSVGLSRNQNSTFSVRYNKTFKAYGLLKWPSGLNHFNRIYSLKKNKFLLYIERILQNIYLPLTFSTQKSEQGNNVLLTSSISKFSIIMPDTHIVIIAISSGS